MPVTISVSEVRQALYRSAGKLDVDGPGTPSTAALGAWFHETLGRLVGGDASAGLLVRLSDVEPDLQAWKQSLVADMYSRFVGPRLTQNQAALQDQAAEVLAFWTALRSACEWVAELTWQLRPARPSQRLTQPPWRALSDLVTVEHALSWEFRKAEWPDSVRLVGAADLIIRLSQTGAWCALEFKLGQTAPLADLAQACLYHLMIARAHAAHGGDSSGPFAAGTLALVSFRPERHEQLFTAAQLEAAQHRLISLIGALAGFEAELPETPSPPPPPIPQPSGGSAGLPSEPKTAAAPNAEHLEIGRRLVRTLADYGVEVALDAPIIVGPAFVRYPIALGPRTRVSAVTSRGDELRAHLRLKAPPFIQFEDGRLVIDVQRPDPQPVGFAAVRDQLPGPAGPAGGSHVPLGVDLAGRLVCADLGRTEHAHLLAAGTTGSGKSEWLRLAVAGLLLSNTPETLRLLVIDPKRNAFHALRRSPFLWRPLVFPDEQPAAGILSQLVDEMERRYGLFDGADSFRELVDRSGARLPRIVCVCDEYRDLISRDRGERRQIEQQICRLGAKARAAGIHLILATQEPSRDTIKGPLDSNIPARVGLRMARDIESRMLLNVDGAECLLGQGDLLFKDIGAPRRLQAPLLTEEDRQAIFDSAPA